MFSASVRILFAATLILLAGEALAATGYKTSTGVDIDTLLQPGSSAIVTGYKVSSGADIGTLFLPASAGAPGPAVGYKNSSGVDIGTLFCAKGTQTPSFISQCVYVGASGWDSPYFNLTDTTTGKVYGLDGQGCTDPAHIDTSLIAGHNYRVDLISGGAYTIFNVKHNGVVVSTGTYSFYCENASAWSIEYS